MVDVSTAWLVLDGWLFSVRHLEASLQRFLLQYQWARNTHSRDHPTRWPLPAQLDACLVPHHSGPPFGDAGALFPLPACQRGLTAGDGPPGQGAKTLEWLVCVMAGFAVADVIGSKPSCWRGVDGGLGGCTRVGGRPMLHTDDGLPMDGFWRINGSRPDLMLVLSCCAYRPIHAPSSAAIGGYRALDQLVAFRLLQVHQFLRWIVCSENQAIVTTKLIRLNRLLVMWFLKACRDGTLRSTSPA